MASAKQFRDMPEPGRFGDEIARRHELFRSGETLRLMRDATVILVDDAVATGSTVFAAIRVVGAC